MAKTQRHGIAAGRIFETIADLGSLTMSFFYVIYVTLLLVFHVGPNWLNFSMLGITIAYIVFFLIKIFSLNRILSKTKVKRTFTMSLRYSKWGMRLLNAAFVGFSVAATTISGTHVISLIGIMIVVISFVISVLWDIGWHFVRRKVRELRTGWDNLSQEEKNARVGSVIDNVVKSVDRVTGLDIAASVRSQLTAAVPAKTRKNQHKRHLGFLRRHKDN